MKAAHTYLDWIPPLGRLRFFTLSLIPTVLQVWTMRLSQGDGQVVLLACLISLPFVFPLVYGRIQDVEKGQGRKTLLLPVWLVLTAIMVCLNAYVAFYPVDEQLLPLGVASLLPLMACYTYLSFKRGEKASGGPGLPLQVKGIPQLGRLLYILLVICVLAGEILSVKLSHNDILVADIANFAAALVLFVLGCGRISDIEKERGKSSGLLDAWLILQIIFVPLSFYGARHEFTPRDLPVLMPAIIFFFGLNLYLFLKRGEKAIAAKQESQARIPAGVAEAQTEAVT
ncbi:MAG TPA: hypothetical protein VEF76_06630 [Patescibacteria group bacterium]|nr:hypothetical protein [Patescibacteria group bacterium]